MKARLLKKMMNDSGYYANDHSEYIAMGSPLCHDLISVNKKTLKVRYALDTFHEGRKSLEGRTNDELLFIWDKFHELIASGQIHEIINGNDEIENPLTVWTFEDGKLIETFTDKYGWPNTTFDGKVMYENTHFKTKKEAIDKGIIEYEAGVSLAERRVKELEEDLQKAKDWLSKEQEYLNHFKTLKSVGKK